VKAVTVISHLLVQHNLTRLRDKRTRPQEFRRVLSEMAALMLYEATRSFTVALTGGAVATMSLLSELRAKHVRPVNLLAAPEGIRHVRRFYPRLPIFTAVVDKKLNHKGYILPGLGDAGDRLFRVGMA